MSATSLNEQLRTEYEAALGVDELVPNTGSQSGPQLLCVPDSYLECRVKLMIVGQEPYGWYEGKFAAPYDVPELMKASAEFGLGGRRRGTPFWQAAHEVYRRLNPDGPPDAFLWSNLVKLDVGGRRPGEDLTSKVLGLRLLQRELTITRPDVVVFFTGPTYDRFLFDSFPDTAQSEIVPGLDHIRDDSGVLPPRTFRTYHPRYLRMARRWNLVQEVVNAARAG